MLIFVISALILHFLFLSILSAFGFSAHLASLRNDCGQVKGVDPLTSSDFSLGVSSQS